MNTILKVGPFSLKIFIGQEETQNSCGVTSINVLQTTNTSYYIDIRVFHVGNNDRYGRLISFLVESI